MPPNTLSGPFHPPVSIQVQLGPCRCVAYLHGAVVELKQFQIEIHGLCVDEEGMGVGFGGVGGGEGRGGVKTHNLSLAEQLTEYISHFGRAGWAPFVMAHAQLSGRRGPRRPSTGRNSRKQRGRIYLPSRAAGIRYAGEVPSSRHCFPFERLETKSRQHHARVSQWGSRP